MSYEPTVHTIRYKAASTDSWWYMHVHGSSAEMIKQAKGVGKAELGKPAYHEVQVVEMKTLPVVWSSRDPIPQTELEPTL